MDVLRNECELVGDSHALRMGNVLNNRPYTKRRDGLAVSGCTTQECLDLFLSHPPLNKQVVLVIGCNDIIQTLKLPKNMQEKEFGIRKTALFALLKQMAQYSCFVLEVFPIPRMEELYGDIARHYLTLWNLIIKKFNGLGGIKMINTQHLICFSNHQANKGLYERFITTLNNPDYVHLNKEGYTLILEELASFL